MECKLNVDAVVLAAGQSTRMGEKNKLLARFEGEELITRVVWNASASKIRNITVVTGYQSGAIEDCLIGLDVEFVHNSIYEEGMASSLQAGIGVITPDCDGALIILADMPSLDVHHFDRLIDVFCQHEGKAIIRAVNGDKPGNPVIIPRDLLIEIEQISGDEGARSVLTSHIDDVIYVDIGEAAGLDVDTPEALKNAGGIFTL